MWIRSKPYKETPEEFEERNVSKTSPMVRTENGEELYVVESLLKKRKQQRGTEYLVKWLGYPIEDSTCEPKERISHVEHWHKLLRAFETTNKQ